jgi:D-lactate dehydrogenase
MFTKVSLDAGTAVLAKGFPAVCIFVNDTADEETLRVLQRGGTRLIALRCAGFNNVDLKAADDLGMTVVRVPRYSPYSVAEHVVALIQTLNRKIHRAYNRVREGNLALDGLLGFDLHGKTLGILGTGLIGCVLAKIMHGFDCRLLGCDPYENDDFRRLGSYVSMEELLAASDIISLHCPLTPQTRHLIDGRALQLIKPGCMLINTSRGALVDTQAAIDALKQGRLGALGLDVYEEEADLFFEDLSNHVIQDDVFARLLTFPNVVITGHQGFFTQEAIEQICETTLANVTAFDQGHDLPNRVSREMLAAG